MRINEPKTAAEIQAESNFPIWPAGNYDFEIRAAEDTVSKKGNDMIKLTVDIFNDEGRKQTLFDYLLESMAFKLRHCVDVCGLASEYEGGRLDPIDFEGKTGKCKIAVDPASGDFPSKNSIKDYIVEAKAEAAPKRAMADELDDLIPF